MHIYEVTTLKKFLLIKLFTVQMFTHIFEKLIIKNKELTIFDFV